jgi:hypothetical protein
MAGQVAGNLAVGQHLVFGNDDEHLDAVLLKQDTVE